MLSDLDTLGIDDAVMAVKPAIMEIFEHLHAHPEVSWQEFETTAYLADRIGASGVSVKTFEECPGLVAETGSGQPLIAIRSDLDALWQELDPGQFRANHSCGHDAHMAVVMGVFLTLNQLSSLPAGTIRYIFQPAEEKGEGALKMMSLGALDGVSHLFGLHLRPIQELSSGQASTGILHGAGCFLDGLILGEDAHGARPHLGVNAIEVASALVQALSGLRFDPRVPWSAKMTRLRAGGDNVNIIPGKANFSLDLRAQTNAIMDEMIEAVERICRALEDQFRVTIQLEVRSKIVAATACPPAETILAEAIADVLGEEHCHPPLVTPGGEDFHFYTHRLPDLKATMLGLGCNLQPGLHHPRMTFERESLMDGVRILSRALVLTLGRCQGGEP